MFGACTSEWKPSETAVGTEETCRIWNTKSITAGLLNSEGWICEGDLWLIKSDSRPLMNLHRTVCFGTNSDTHTDMRACTHTHSHATSSYAWHVHLIYDGLGNFKTNVDTGGELPAIKCFMSRTGICRSLQNKARQATQSETKNTQSICRMCQELITVCCFKSGTDMPPWKLQHF